MKLDIFRRIVALVLVPLAVAACDNPVEEEHGDHAQGLVLLNAQGAEVARLVEGPTVTGQVVVPAGSTQTFTGVGISGDGDQVQLGGEFGVGVETQPSNATLTVQGGSQLVVAAGSGTGASTARIQLLHEDHADLAGDVPVIVQ